MQQSPDLSTLSFEDALVALEQAVSALEKGDQSLEEAIAFFERGMRLARICGVRLDSAELRLREVEVGSGPEGEGVPTGQASGVAPIEGGSA